MFREIPEPMQKRMTYLEERDRQDRIDGTDKLKRLRQIPPETGKFIALLAASCPKGNFIEIGTSAGYSSMWISLALRERSEKLITYEILPEKTGLAKETFALAGISDIIDLREGDFLHLHDELDRIAFCFLDCEKDLYEKCFDAVSGKIVSGGLLIADNAIDHYEFIKGMMKKAENDERFDCVTVPIGKGEFVCRRK